MATRTYIPTKENQDLTLEKLNTLQADVDGLKETLGASRLATITVRFNWATQSHQLPTDEDVLADLLNGAKVVLRVAGLDYPYEAQVTKLENFETTFQVFVTDAAKTTTSSVGIVLGKSTKGAYAVTSDAFALDGGTSRTIYLNTKQATGEKVEIFRAQPYHKNPSSLSESDRLRIGSSYLGTRITTSNGYTDNFGHWNSTQSTWIDDSLTKVSLWNVPKNSDGTPGTPEERVITTTDNTDGWVSLDDRLDCIKNIKIGTVSYTNGTTTVGDNKMVRYDKLYVKTTHEKMNMPIEDAEGNLTDNYVDCIVKWYCNEKADEDYHLHPLFEKYVRNADGSYTTIECAHGYIARYPIGNTVNMTLDGASQPVPQWKSGVGQAYVPGNRLTTLNYCRNMNKCTATLSFDGEDDITITPDETNRTWGVAGTREISFLATLAYLYFGVNVQGGVDNPTSTSEADKANRTFPGICVSSADGTKNGATDHIIVAGKVNGAIDTRLCTNSIVFLGVEDALWSSTGWYWEDLTFVARLIVTSNEKGEATYTNSYGFLFAQDAADVAPGQDLSNEFSANDTLCYEGQLKAAGYREASFEAGSSWFRAGVDNSTVLRDAYLPASVQDQDNINTGACDNFWRGGVPSQSTFNFSTSTSYTVGDYCIYTKDKTNYLYKCTESHTAGAWDDAHFELVLSATVKRRNYYLVALDHLRSHGSYLGAFCVSAAAGLSISRGDAWRARPSLLEVS